MDDMELLSVAEKYFGGDINIAKIWFKKYGINGETPVDVWKRLAKLTSEVEKDEIQKEWDGNFYDILKDWKFVPGGRILFALTEDIKNKTGRRKITPFNCYFLPQPEDNLESIFDIAQKAARIYSHGGGCGIDVSKIRPKGAKVNNSAIYSDGVVPFMNLYSAITDNIAISGRRGALLLSISDKSLDLLNFINAKKDHAKINSANISVKLSDAFMKAVESDGDWEMCFKVKDTNEEIKQTHKARFIFDNIVENNWTSAEPGILFWDRALRWTPNEYFDESPLLGCNPCVAKGSLVATENGWIEVEKIKKGDLIFSQNQLYPVDEIEINKNYPVFRVKFSDGDYLDVTKGHKFKCIVDKQYQYLRLDEIKEGSRVLVEPINIKLMKNHLLNLDKKIPSRDLGLLIGSVLGDGSYTKKITNPHSMYICFGKKETKWQNLIEETLKNNSYQYYISNEATSNRIYSTQFGNFLEKIGVERNKSFEKKIPENFINSNNEKFLVGILDGLFSTDGNMYLKKDNPMLRFSSTSYELCRQIRRLLFSFGIHAKIYHREKSSHVYKDPINGERVINGNHDSYVIVIMNEGIKLFFDHIGLSNPYKKEKLEKCVKQYHFIGDNKVAIIKSITPIENADVYDLHVKETDEWNVQGYVQQGCSEQILPAWGNCNLGSINLTKFVKWAFASRVEFDWDSFKTTVKHAVRFLDNVNELAIKYKLFPFQEQIDESVKSRRIGLGIMALADVFVMLGIKYDSDKAIDFAKKLFETMRNTAYEYSCDLGVEKGNFKMWNYEKWAKSKFVQNMPDYIRDKAKNGLRNLTLLSIAPTGSIALLAGVSSSTEPIFSLEYHRTVNLGDSVGQTMKFYHPLYKRFLDKKYEMDESIWVTAHNIDWKFRIKMQGVIQQYVCTAISNTINLPTSATKQDIHDIFMMAWKEGLKGTTVYRNSCRENILSTKKSRPAELTGKTYQIKNENEDTFYITINDILEGLKLRPFELFINSKESNEYLSLITRLISAIFRRTNDSEFVIKQIEKSTKNKKGILLKLASVLSEHMGLKKPMVKSVYVTNPVVHVTNPVAEAIGMEICPSCGQRTLKKENGCSQCICGFGECSV